MRALARHRQTLLAAVLVALGAAAAAYAPTERLLNYDNADFLVFWLCALVCKGLGGKSGGHAYEGAFVAGMIVSGGPITALCGDVLAALLVAATSPSNGGRRFRASVAAASGATGLASLALLAPLTSELWHIPPMALFYAAFALAIREAFRRIGAGKTPHFQRRDLGVEFALGLSVALALSLCLALFWGHSEVFLSPVLLLPVALLTKTTRLHDELIQHDHSVIAALTLMLQRVHPYSAGHLERVASIAEEVGLALGLPPRRARMLHLAALLHDVGKIAIDEELLDRPGPLSDEEMAEVRKHAQYGAEILARVRRFEQIIAWVRSHHERPDSKGYPEGLSGGQIPLESKIISVVDAFDAMTGEALGGEARKYRKPMSIPEAFAELRDHAGSQFDATVVEAFCKIAQERWA